MAWEMGIQSHAERPGKDAILLFNFSFKIKTWQQNQQHFTLRTFDLILQFEIVMK